MLITSYSQVKELIISKYGEKRFFTKPYDLNIFGLRSDNYVPDTFDDYIGVAYTNEAGFKKLFLCEATTDPSTFYLLNPANPSGTGILPSGNYPALFGKGLHKGYPALVQNSPVKIIRDIDRNNIACFDVSKAVKFETGMFGLDLHRYNAEQAILSANEGSMLCQVICDPVDFDIFMRLIDAQITKHNINSFSYTLFWENH